MPGPAKHQIKTSGIDFIDFWSQDHKVIKSRLMGLILSMPEHHRISTSGNDFVDICSQAQEVIKSRHLEPRPRSHQIIIMISSTFRSQARKSSNRYSWDWFCRLLRDKATILSNRNFWDWFCWLLEPRKRNGTNTNQNKLNLEFRARNIVKRNKNKGFTTKNQRTPTARRSLPYIYH